MEENKYESYYAENLEKCIEIIKREDEMKSDSINSISIHGDRGFGKTTFLNLLKTKLKDEGNIIVSDIIDPINLFRSINNSFEYTYKILEVLLYTYYNQMIKCNDFDQRQKLKELSSIIEKQNNVKRTDEAEIGSGLSLLTRLENNFSLNTKLSELFSDQKIVLIIDDLDMLENQMIKKLTDELHAFIGVKNVYFVTAYKESQLYNALLTSELEAVILTYKNNNITDKDIQERVSNKIMKTYPYEYIIKLPSITKFYESNVDENNNYMSKKDFVISKLSELFDTRIEPFSPDESINFLLPSTPRSYNQFIEVLKYIEGLTKGEKYISPETMIRRYQYFTEYIYTMIQESTFPISYKEVIEKYRNAEYEQKNWIVIGSIREFASQLSDQAREEKISNVCFISEVRDGINASISDVVETLNDFKNLNINTIDNEFVYFLKLLITIDNAILICKMETSLDNDIRFNLEYEKYKQIVRGNILPYNYNMFGLEGVYSHLSLKHIKNIEGTYEKRERALALYTLVSLYGTGSVFVDNSGFAKHVSEIDKEIFINNTSKARRWNMVRLYERIPEYDQLTYKNVMNNENFLTVVNEYREKINYVAFSSNEKLAFDPLLFFTKQELIREVLSNASTDWKKLIIGNIFSLEEVHDYNTFRPGEMYPVVRVIRKYLTNFGYYTKISEVNDSVKFITDIVGTRSEPTGITKNFITDNVIKVSLKKQNEIRSKIATLNATSDDNVEKIVEYLLTLDAYCLTKSIIGESASSILETKYKKIINGNANKRLYVTTMVSELADYYGLKRKNNG